MQEHLMAGLALLGQVAILGSFMWGGSLCCAHFITKGIIKKNYNYIYVGQLLMIPVFLTLFFLMNQIGFL